MRMRTQNRIITVRTNRYDTINTCICISAGEVLELISIENLSNSHSGQCMFGMYERQFKNVEAKIYQVFRSGNDNAREKVYR